MKLAVEIIAWYGGTSLLACALLAIVGLLLAARRETRAVEEAMERHPANGCEGRTPPAVRYLGGNDDVTPFSARTVCGHLIWGDSLGDLLANEVYHYRVCEQLKRRAA